MPPLAQTETRRASGRLLPQFSMIRVTATPNDIKESHEHHHTAFTRPRKGTRSRHYHCRRRRPLPFSLLARCHGEYGSA